MSIFDGDDINPVPYLSEKTLSALQYAAALIDLANEPDTTTWYKRNLMEIAEGIVVHLVPAVAVLNWSGQESAEQSRAILNGGTFALARWCKKHNIGNPTQIGKKSLAALRLASDSEEKAAEIAPAPFDGDTASSQNLKLQVYNSMCLHLLHHELPVPAQRMLLWMLSGLWLSHPPDVIHISRRFLPTDIGISREETNEAYRLLHTRGIIERVDDPDTQAGGDRINLRLVVQGLNESRHPPEFKEENFGYPGARIAGKTTSGQTIFVHLSETMSTRFCRWFKEEKDLPELRDMLQAAMGEDKVYIESARIEFYSEKPRIVVKFRYPMDSDLEFLEAELSAHADTWMKENIEQITAKEPE
jgi:hypothetical protein